MLRNQIKKSEPANDYRKIETIVKKNCSGYIISKLVKINFENYSKILNALDVSPHLAANTNNRFLEASSAGKQEFFPSREQDISSGSKSTPKKRSVIKYVLSFPEVKNDQFYSKGPASYESAKRLHTQSKLCSRKLQS